MDIILWSSRDGRPSSSFSRLQLPILSFLLSRHVFNAVIATSKETENRTRNMIRWRGIHVTFRLPVLLAFLFDLISHASCQTEMYIFLHCLHESLQVVNKAINTCSWLFRKSQVICFSFMLSSLKRRSTHCIASVLCLTDLVMIWFPCVPLFSFIWKIPSLIDCTHESCSLFFLLRKMKIFLLAFFVSFFEVAWSAWKCLDIPLGIRRMRRHRAESRKLEVLSVLRRWYENVSS